MNMIKIDKGLEIPPRRGGFGGGARSKYPWQYMDVGDSFFIGVSIRTISGAVSVRQKRHGERYTCRIVTENGVKGVRVWRIE